VLRRRTSFALQGALTIFGPPTLRNAIPVKIALALDAEAYCRYEALDDTAAEAKWQDTRLACFAKSSGSGPATGRALQYVTSDTGEIWISIHEITLGPTGSSSIELICHLSVGINAAQDWTLGI
jgi:hypothetical protein